MTQDPCKFCFLFAFFTFISDRALQLMFIDSPPPPTYQGLFQTLWQLGNPTSCSKFPMDNPIGRMALLVTLFLVLVNIFNSVTANAPKTEGLTAVETWVVSCIIHVFGVLAEYAVILKIIQTQKRKESKQRREERSQKLCLVQGDGETSILNHIQEDLGTGRYRYEKILVQEDLDTGRFWYRKI